MTHPMTETRRLTLILTLPEVEALRRQLRPGEGMNDLLRRIVNDRIHNPTSPMITYTTSTQQAMARIATAPATSEQARPKPTPFTRLSLAACPMPRRCSKPCQTCTAVARSVAAELGQILRECHGGSSSVADWLEGMRP
jgi:hypothetical protein